MTFAAQKPADLPDATVPLTSAPSTSVAPPSWRRWGETLAILALFFLQAGWPVPDSNETHYPCKAQHYWNAGTAQGDFFLESSDSHLVFYWSVGWLTRFLSLEAFAWCGRLLTWGLLAWAWQRLSYAMIPRPWWSIATAAVFITLQQRCEMAGEWVVGGVEGKGFAYAYVILALDALVRDRWLRGWLCLGIAAAFHVLVGGWALVAITCAWLCGAVGDPKNAGRLTGSMLTGPLLAGLVALPGLLPALALTWGVDHNVVEQANVIYVFRRLRHHLDFSDFATWQVLAHGLLLVGWIVLCRVTRCEPRQRPVRAFVHGVVLIALVGIAISLSAPSPSATKAALLRYYWFRLSDAMLPLGVALIGGVWLANILGRRPQFGRCAALLLITLVTWHLGVQAVATTTAVVPRGVQVHDAEQWSDACRWARRNTPRDARFMTPRESQSFLWYAGRSEVVNWKNIPQDAPGIVAWWQRMRAIYRVETAEGQSRWCRSLAEIPLDRLERLAAQYDAQFLLTRSEPRLALPRVYENNSYAVYRLAPR